MPGTEKAPTSPLDIVNLAIVQLGEDELTDLLPESGATNATANRLYTRIVDSLLTRHNWNFATRNLLLSALVDAPPDPWTTQYNLPANTLRVLGTDQNGEAYELAANHDPTDTTLPRRLYASRTGVRCRVIVRPLDELFPPHFVDAIVAELIVRMRPAVRDMEPFQSELLEARQSLARAKVIDASESPPRLFHENDPRGSRAGDYEYLPGYDWTN